MAILKCKMCGGDILLSEDKTTGTCDHCGSTMTFPRVSDEQKLNLYNRANHFRRQNEFDKAITAYERILDQDDTDAEAHWGAVLSRYGIEYVEDPVTHERIPTCHRVQLSSILSDGDYLATLENAPDTASRDLYEQEARRIAEIQKGILSISSQEKPYDVFICYKETDDSGRRTKDSTLAQEIYYQLTNEGYKVFFSRITLEDKLGQQYEPYIFAALNSAKVMLVIGTKPEYFNAVWVKNEWSRYLALMKNDRSRLLIPCYRDMDAYDLPDDLSGFQSQDMSKIGFVQDLIRGIKKITVKEESKPQAAPQIVAAAGANIENLMKRARLFMEDGDFKSANEYLDKVLDEDAEYAPAYAGKVCTALGFRKESDLAEATFLYADHPDWKKALRFATPEQRAVYEEYYKQVKPRVDQQIRDYAYDCAMEMAVNPKADQKKLNQELEQYVVFCETYENSRADGSRRKNAHENEMKFRQAVEENDPGEVAEQGYLAAAEMFRLIGENNADTCAENCLALAEQARKKAIHLRAAEMEAKQRADKAKIQAEEARRKEEIRRVQEADQLEAKKKRNRCLAILAAILTIATFFVVTKIILPKGHYDKGISLRNAEQWEDALDEFEQAKGYSDVATQILATYYAEGKKYLYEGKWDEAVIAFELADNYSDAPTQILETRYQEGLAAQEQGNWDTAINAFALAKNYKDAAKQILSTYYKKGIYYQSENNWEKAIDAFKMAGEYPDAKKQISETYYLQAKEYINKGRFSDAYTIFKKIRGYKDVNDLVQLDGNLAAIKEQEIKTFINSIKQKGNTVTWGMYEQDNDETNGKEPIEWIVLNVQANKSLIISKYGLDGITVGNKRKDSITWDNSYKRLWLNTVFYENAFSVTEKKAIILTEVDNSKSQGSERSENGGENTFDYLFLLSYKEAMLYFPSNASRAACYGTKYAVIRSGLTNRVPYRDKFDWWLRTPGYSDGCVMYVYTSDTDRDGEIFGTGQGTDSTYCLMRPAMWVSQNIEDYQ